MHSERATRSAPGVFAWRLGSGPDSIAGARHAFRAWLEASSASADDIADLAVVLSELAANALAGSAGGPTGGSADIHAGLEGDELWLEVVNELPNEAPDVLRWDLDDPLRGGGRGLMIVRAYTDSMEVGSVDGTVSVRCTRHLELGS